MSSASEPVHILRDRWQTDEDLFGDGPVEGILSRRQGMDSGTWCGLPRPKKNYAYEGSVRARKRVEPHARPSWGATTPDIKKPT